MTDVTAAGCNAPSAVALGFFDGLHLGHIEVIKQAMSAADRDGLKSVIFTFNNNTMLPKFTTRRNIISYELKRERLDKIGVALRAAPDFATVRNLSPSEFVNEILVKGLKAKYVTCGYDFRFGKGGAADAEELSRLCGLKGVRVEVVPAVKLDGQTVSSTAIRELIGRGEVAEANRMLGYELTYDLVVLQGNKIGREMGFRTINQAIPEGNVMPRLGVYKSWAQIDGRNYPAVTNIGYKPTIALREGEKERTPQMETHIIGFDGDLYGVRARVVLREFIREERRYADLDELKAQLEKDKLAVLS